MFGFGVGIQRLGSFGVDTHASLLALAAPGSGLRPTGFVYADPDNAKNGVYTWTGSAWVRDRGLPEQIATLTVTGGTANAIVATAQAGVDLSQIVICLLTPTAPNTGAVTLNGKAVKDADGAALIAGALVSGKTYLLVDRGTEFRALLNEFAHISDIVGLSDALDDRLRIDTDEQGLSDEEKNNGRENLGLAPGATTFIFATKAEAQATIIPLDVHTITLTGFASESDGRGGQWTDDAGKGSGDEFVGTDPRSWRRVKDVSKARAADDLTRYIDGPKLPKKEKWIISSDWQPVNTEPTQIAYLRSVMDSFKTHHSDASYLICPGDLVDAASANNTGAAPTYGYPQLRADLEARTHLSWERFLALPGNHDRDGIPAGTFERFWSYRTYREHVGPEFYSMTRGNVALLFAGDMAGSNSGEVITYALEWLDRELKRLKGYNCIIFFHQPIYGVHPTGTSEQSTWVQYEGGTRISPILQKYKSQIVFVGYGHVGRSFDTGANVTDLNGVKWINFSLAIPGLFNTGWTAHGVYSTLELTDKATSLTLKRWDVANAAYDNAYDVPLTVPYPLSLGNNFWDWDGRKGVHPQNGVFRDPVTIYGSQSENRENVGGTWGAKPTWTEMLRLIVGDDSAEAVKTGTGPALTFYVPGTSTKTDADAAPVSAYPNGYALGALIAAINLVNTADVHQTKLAMMVADLTDALQTVLELYPSDHALSGVNLPSGYPLRIAGNITIDADGLPHLASFTVAQLAAKAVAGYPAGVIAWCSNGNAGAACLAVSRGGTAGWARIVLGTNISAT